jgi:hypothetical protein
LDFLDSIKAGNNQKETFKDRVNDLRKETDRYDTALASIERVRRSTKLAIERGVGNCQEQPSIPFVYLPDRFGAKLQRHRHDWNG